MYARSLIKLAFIQPNCLLHFVVYIRSSNIFAHVYHSYHNSIGFELQPNVHYLPCAFESLQIQKRYILCLLCLTDFSKFGSKTKNSAGGMPATETKL